MSTTIEWMKKKATKQIIGFQLDKLGLVDLKAVFSQLALLRANFVDHKMFLQLIEGPPTAQLFY